MIWDPSLRTQVFVVDPAAEDYEALQGEKGHANVVFFSSAREALEALGQHNPRMWVVNMRLPDMSGANLQTILKSRGCKAPVALVGDEYLVDDEIEARSAGADMYLAKPIEPSMIFAAA